MVDVYGLGPAGSSFIITYAKLHKGAEIYAYDLSIDKTGRPRSICAGGLGWLALNKIVRVLPEVEYALQKSVQTWVKGFEYIGGKRVYIDRSDISLPNLGVVVDRQMFDMELAKIALNYVNADKPTGGTKIYATGFTGAPRLPPGDVEVLLQYWVETKDVSDTLRLAYKKEYTASGYYWEFPEAKKGVVKVGAGMSLEEMRSKGVTLHKVIEKYMALTGTTGKIVGVAGATLPLTKWRRECTYRGDGIYIGTAGCFVNPATGAGIKLAILSGVAMASGNKNLFKECVREVNKFYRVKKVVVHSPQWAVDKVFDTAKAVGKMGLADFVGKLVMG